MVVNKFFVEENDTKVKSYALKNNENMIEVENIDSDFFEENYM